MTLIEKRVAVEIWRSRTTDEYFVCGVTVGGDPRICPSLGMAREVAAA